jgi:MoaA/NifB/PqqE/SkfB family radical SAM enzyme
MCSRNIRGGKENPNLILNDWTVEDYKKIINEEVLKQVGHLYFCGNFGDPIINHDLLEMCEYTSGVNPDLLVRIHTNGGARTTDWWRKLAKVLPENHAVIFGIDGLEDTHHLYRIGTKFETVIRNARAFIEAGGNAEWVFIKFKHNEHQIEEAESLAKRVGFSQFVVKNTNRFIDGESFNVHDKEGNTIYKLNPPSDNVIKFIDKKVVSKIDDWIKTSTIKCKALDEKEIYIDAHKKVYPCCFLASSTYYYVEKDSIVSSIKDQVVEQHNDLVESLGGIGNIDASINTVKQIIDSDKWQVVWNQYWEEKKLFTCARICGVADKNLFSKPSDQFVKRTNLDE